MDAPSQSIPKTLVRTVLTDLLPYRVDSALVRMEVEEIGLFKALLLEVKDAVVYGVLLSIFMLALLRFAGYTFGTSRLELLFAVGPAVWDFVRSGRTRIILGMIVQRIWTRLKASVRRIASMSPSREHRGNHEN